MMEFRDGEVVGEAEEREDEDGGKALTEKKERGVGGWEASEEDFVKKGETDGGGDVIEGGEEGEEG